MKGKLYLVSTPIGNMGDITLRAIETLKGADLVLAEDTRVTGRLLSHLEIKKPLMSYHEHTARDKHSRVLERILEGETAALCSDAGMPCISDPGQQLVRDAIDEGIEVIPIPGANAMLTALIASGISTDRFTFMGFFPRKKREEEMERVKDALSTLVYYESPMRVVDAVEAIVGVIPERQIVVARELTKLHEEFIRGRADEVLESLKGRESIKGEIVIIIAPAKPKTAEIDDEEIAKELQTLIDGGERLKSAVQRVSESYGLNKNRVYDIGKKL